MPGGVGVGEIGPGVEVFLDRFEVGEFFAVVEGDGFYEGETNCTECIADRATDGVGAPVWNFLGQEVAVFAFDEGQDGGSGLPAQDKVGFPVAGAVSLVDNLGAFFDADAAGQQSAFALVISAPSPLAVGWRKCV